MGDDKGVSGSSLKYVNFLMPRKYLILTLFVIVLLILFSGGFGIIKFIENKFFAEEEFYCGDGTSYNLCSSHKPYFCLNGSLIENASLCGCYEGDINSGKPCISEYQTRPKEIQLEYILEGEKYFLNFTVYEGILGYLSGISKSIKYSNGDIPSRGDFKLKNIDEEEQRKMLLPLVVKIQNLTLNKEDQIRIAISIVQNIPYGSSDKTTTFGAYQLNYSRYPYEVLYDTQGICGEKTDLLAFLLREMGYGVSVFYYQEENHEAIGVKCPISESMDRSGYCFVETTGPSIITDDRITYSGVGKLYSEPEIYLISEGESIGKDFYEYRDADRLIKIRNSIEKSGWLGPLREKEFSNIKKKYGLVDKYFGG